MVIVIQQEKMQIPIAEDLKPQSVEKMMKMVFNEMQQRTKSFRTGFWVSIEDYEQMGKPTVGDMIKIQIEKIAEPEWKVSKPKTPFPFEQVVLFEMKQLGGDTLLVEKQKLIDILLAKTKFPQKDIERTIKRMLRLGALEEPKENYLSVPPAGEG